MVRWFDVIGTIPPSAFAFFLFIEAKAYGEQGVLILSQVLVRYVQVPTFDMAFRHDLKINQKLLSSPILRMGKMVYYSNSSESVWNRVTSSNAEEEEEEVAIAAALPLVVWIETP